MSLPRYCFSLEGSAYLMRAAAEAQGEVLEPFFETPDWEYDSNVFLALPALAQNRRPMAFGLGEVAIYICGFIATCFGKKIFDEVYDRTAKRPIGAMLDRFFGEVDIPAGKSVEYRDVIYLEDIDLVVVIRVIAEKEKTASLLSQVMQAHRIAHTYIEQHGRKAPIHCHKIDDGLVAMEPELFNTLAEIKLQENSRLKSLRRDWPRKTS